MRAGQHDTRRGEGSRFAALLFYVTLCHEYGKRITERTCTESHRISTFFSSYIAHTRQVYSTSVYIFHVLLDATGIRIVNVVSVVTTLLFLRSRNRSSIPGRGNKFFSSPKCAHRLGEGWGLPSFLFNRYLGRLSLG